MVVNGAPKGGIVRETVDKGDRVVLVVRSDVADEIHLHGYDIMRDVAPGKPARLPFKATIPGRFEVELEGRGVQIADITVERVSSLAHGIGVVRDLPIPAIYFFVGAAVVLAVSFVLLFSLWRRPLLEAHAGGRALPHGLLARSCSRARCGSCSGRSPSSCSA